jgi:uncharacterized protein (DUF2237 family)
MVWLGALAIIKRTAEVRGHRAGARWRCVAIGQWQWQLDSGCGCLVVAVCVAVAVAVAVFMVWLGALTIDKHVAKVWRRGDGAKWR